MRPSSLVVVLGLAGLAVVPFTCTTERDVEDYGPSGRRVLLVGVEGLSWGMMRPLLGDGDTLPTLTGLQARMSRRTLGSASADPMRPSGLQPPKSWITIASGSLHQAHGVSKLAVRSPQSYGETPVSSIHRRIPTVWEMASAFGLDVAVAGWWATWPAEWVRGTVVSDRFFAERFDCGPYGSAGHPRFGAVEPAWREGPADHLTFPDALAETLAEELRGADEHEFLRFLARQREDETDVEIARDLETLESAVRHDLLMVASLERSLGSVDLGAGILSALDVAIPLFWKYQNAERFQDPSVPEAIRRGLEPDRIRRLKPVVTESLEFVDEQLGRLVRAMGPDAFVVLVSSHGWRVRTEFALRRLSLNPLLEELGMLERDASGAVDTEASLCFDRELQPYKTLRSLSLNFESDYPNGFVKAVGDKQRASQWHKVVTQIRKVKSSVPWNDERNGRNNYRGLDWYLGAGHPGWFLLVGLFTGFPSNTVFSLPTGTTKTIDELFPPQRHSAQINDVPLMLVVAPEGVEPSGIAQDPPIGQESIGRQTVAPTVSALLGLPRPVPAPDPETGRPIRPARFQDWMIPRELAQEAAIALVPELDYLRHLGRLGADTESGRRHAQLRDELLEAGILGQLPLPEKVPADSEE